jgi:hypothetical protein
VSWKEAGGYSIQAPVPVMVEIPVSLSAGTTYTIKLRWKANQSDPGTLYTGAGPINGAYASTRLIVLPLSVSSSVVSTKQYTLTNNNGSSWVDLDDPLLSFSYTPSSTCQALLSANADLFVGTFGYNIDLGMVVSGGAYGSEQMVSRTESEGWHTRCRPLMGGDWERLSRSALRDDLLFFELFFLCRRFDLVELAAIFHAVDEEHAVEVIDLVLEGACLPSFGLDLDGFAGAAHAANRYPLLALHRTVPAGNAQAALVGLDLFL